MMLLLLSRGVFFKDKVLVTGYTCWIFCLFAASIWDARFSLPLHRKFLVCSWKAMTIERMTQGGIHIEQYYMMLAGLMCC